MQPERETWTQHSTHFGSDNTFHTSFLETVKSWPLGLSRPDIEIRTEPTDHKWKASNIGVKALGAHCDTIYLTLFRGSLGHICSHSLAIRARMRSRPHSRTTYSIGLLRVCGSTYSSVRQWGHIIITQWKKKTYFDNMFDFQMIWHKKNDLFSFLKQYRRLCLCAYQAGNWDPITSGHWRQIVCFMACVNLRILSWPPVIGHVNATSEQGQWDVEKSWTETDEDII